MGGRRRPSLAVPPPLTLITLCAAVTVICLGLVAGQMDWADDDEDPGKFVFLSIQPDPQGGLKLCLSGNTATEILAPRIRSLPLSSDRLGTSYGPARGTLLVCCSVCAAPLGKGRMQCI